MYSFLFAMRYFVSQPGGFYRKTWYLSEGTWHVIRTSDFPGPRTVSVPLLEYIWVARGGSGTGLMRCLAAVCALLCTSIASKHGRLFSLNLLYAAGFSQTLFSLLFYISKSLPSAILLLSHKPQLFSTINACNTCP